MTFERVYIPSIEASNAINAAADRSVKQADMVAFYRDCIIADNVLPRVDRVDWKAVNEAILKRWPRGLNKIKGAAWKLLGY